MFYQEYNLNCNVFQYDLSALNRTGLKIHHAFKSGNLEPSYFTKDLIGLSKNLQINRTQGTVENL